MHRRTTAVEVWEDTRGAVDAFVSAVGTGGTITGVGEVLKARKRVRVIAVEPAGPALLSGGVAGDHPDAGDRGGLHPEILNRSLLDEVIAPTDEEASACARRLAREEGIPARGSRRAPLPRQSPPARAGQALVGADDQEARATKSSPSMKPTPQPRGPRRGRQGHRGFDGYFKRVNPSLERTLGHPRPQLFSRPVLDVTHPDDLQPSREALAQLTEGHDLVGFARQLRRSGLVSSALAVAKSLPARRTS